MLGTIVSHHWILVLLSLGTSSVSHARCQAVGRSAIFLQTCPRLTTKTACLSTTDDAICGWEEDSAKPSVPAARPIASVHPFICSNGNTYSAWVDPTPLKKIFDGPNEFKMRGFCRSTILNQKIYGSLNPSQPFNSAPALNCLRDEFPDTGTCLEEFKAKGNTVGTNMISPNYLRHNPPKEWFDEALTIDGPALNRACASTAVDLKIFSNRRVVETGSQLARIYARSNPGGMSMTGECFDKINGAFSELAAHRQAPSKNADAAR